MPVPGSDPEDAADSALRVVMDSSPRVVVGGGSADVGSERSLGVAGMVGMCPLDWAVLKCS